MAPVNDIIVVGAASAPADVASENKEATELLHDVGFYAEQIMAMAIKEHARPRAARRLDWLERIAEEIGEAYKTLVLDGRGK